jgi:VanZ family protein
MIRGRWAWVVGWAVLIEVLLLWPSPPDVPQLPWGIGFDKIVHAGLFGVQAALGAWALEERRRSPWPALAGAITFGALTEVQQQLMPSRAMELGDFLADAAGAVIGLALFAALAPTRRELHR